MAKQLSPKLIRITSEEIGVSDTSTIFRAFFNDIQNDIDKLFITLISNLKEKNKTIFRKQQDKSSKRFIDSVSLIGGSAYRLFGKWVSEQLKDDKWLNETMAPRTHDYDIWFYMNPNDINKPDTKKKMIQCMVGIMNMIELKIIEKGKVDQLIPFSDAIQIPDSESNEIINYLKQWGTSRHKYLRIQLLDINPILNTYHIQLNINIDGHVDHIIEFICTYNECDYNIHNYKLYGYEFSMPTIESFINKTFDAIKNRGDPSVIRTENNYKCKQDTARLIQFINSIEECHKKNIKDIKDQISLEHIKYFKQKLFKLITEEFIYCDVINPEHWNTWIKTEGTHRKSTRKCRKSTRKCRKSTRKCRKSMRKCRK